MQLIRLSNLVAVAGLALCGSAAWAAEAMVTPEDLLRDARFRAAYSAALGPKAKTAWLAKLDNSALVRTVTVGGVAYQVATPCKPHDCADNNMLVMYAPASGTVVGMLHEKGRGTLIGAPAPALAAEVEKLWRKEFRQQ